LVVSVLLLMLAACGEERYEEGYQAGIESAKAELAETVYEDGYTEGYSDGFSEGALAERAAAEAEPEEVPAAIPEYEKNGFVLVTDVIPDAILEMRYYSTFNFVGERIDAYEAPVAFLTKEAADALKQVSDDLMEQGYRLKIYDAYRPQTAVNHFKSWAADPEDTRMKEYFYPELDKSVLFYKGFIASKSGHSRGSTVDLTIVDMKTGREVDMGCGFDFFGEISYSARTEGLTQEQIENRRILREAMVAHGFKALKTEWWHFSLEEEPYPDTYFDFPITIPAQDAGE